MALREVLPSDLEIFFEQQRDPDALRMAAMPGREGIATSAVREFLQLDLARRVTEPLFELE